jgi:fucose permease
VTDPASRRPRAGPGAVLVLAMLAFAGIGLNEATLGVVFPPVRESFDLPLDRLGLLLLPSTGGYLLVAAAQARATRPWPVGRSLIGAAALAVAGSATYALSPVFAVMLVGSLLLGASGGGVDTTLNSYGSRHFEPHVLAFMHGGFGLGAMAGPFVASQVLRAGWSWRWAYVGFGVFQAALVAGWFVTRRRLSTVPPAVPPGSASASPVGPGADVVAFEGDVGVLPGAEDQAPPRRSPMILPLNVGMFFLYTGTEASTGLLLPTLLVERGVAGPTAGLVATAFWTALTVGRFATGFLGRRVAPNQALAGATIGCVVGMLGVALGQGALTGAAGVLVGLALGPVFPSLVAMTPARVGAERTHVAIAFQLAAASLGVAAVPAVIGVVAGRRGPAVIGACLLVVAALLAGLHVLTATVAGDLRGRSGR